ncbi:hypothetical protein [Streptomyces sp. NPDC088727]|uniref:hypothetical protein n=1 Tax=Streptomyces sp. NPDC088727 TaxID=3365875 RepID=UPI0037F6E7BC
MKQIKQGQVYRSLDPRDELYDEGARLIKIVGMPVTDPGQHNFGKVEIVTMTTDGQEVRRRRISLTQLHMDPTGKNGSPRRTGYVLVGRLLAK